MYEDGPVFKAEGASFRDQPYGRELPQGLWTTGLCDCHQDGHICVQTAIVPCISFAQNTEIVNRGTIRQGLGNISLPEEPCNDFWVHLFCTSCAICQESRELKNRGADPSISWLSNVEKWSREKVTPPIVVPGMTR
ncbi:hypothetical protein Bca52824_015435 [Brassica carinata]|uniref:Uncharacterized protein n=1 Tax=Brassica carinata TaxID=52824 RepID=A0A8X8B5H3_BRACI|nr:hypothetical protein Bca52824_015435 [Brassica carinata]